MARIEIGKYLATDSRICGGKLTFKGSRIKVTDAIELSKAGYTPEQIAEQYNNIISPEAVKEALHLIRKGLIKEIDVKTAA